MLFTCDTIRHPEIRAKLEKIANVKSITQGPLCLPNIHPKKGLESPPQFVAATEGTVVPMLSAPAMNCGMSLFATTLTKDDFSPKFLTEFAANLRSAVEPRASRWQIVRGWLGLWKRREHKYDLTPSELEDFFLNGSAAAIKKYGLPSDELGRIEYGGCVLSENEKKNIDFASLVPRSSYTNGRHELGYNFGGNHFLEIQCVEKILDAERARTLGIAEGMVVLFYHGGGGHATYHLGRYFARRAKNTRLEKFILFWLKAFFHFGSREGLRNFRARWRAYFSRKPFPEIPLDTPEGMRLWRSIQIGLNYGYAFRTALLARINDALPRGAQARFLWDAAHNSIMKETIDGRECIVHRQDAVRVFPGKPVMIVGLNNTLSYLGMGSEGAAQSLWSCTPSATQVLEEKKRSGAARPENPPAITLVSKRKIPDLIQKDHITSEGLFEVVQEFEKEDIIKPVAYLRPLGGIKGH